MLATKNYKFKKPELTDSPPDITVMNPNWDDIDDKLFKVIQAWEDFKTNGGGIGSDISLPTGKKIIVGKTEFYNGAINAWANNEHFAIHLNQGKGLIPVDGIDRQNSLGEPQQPWQDVYLGLPSKNSTGYTKLPNGFILQWVQIEARTNGNYTVNFPINFPNECLGAWTNHKSGQDGSNFDESQYNTLEWTRSTAKFKRYNSTYWAYPTTFAIGY